MNASLEIVRFAPLMRRSRTTWLNPPGFDGYSRDGSSLSKTTWPTAIQVADRGEIEPVRDFAQR